MPIVNQTAAPGDAEDVLTSYARVLRALTTDRPIDLERFERTVEVSVASLCLTTSLI